MRSSSSSLLDHCRADQPPDARRSCEIRCSTDAAGRFEITSVVPGVYYVVVIPSSYGGRYLAGVYGAVRGDDPGKPITVAGGAGCEASTSRASGTGDRRPRPGRSRGAAVAMPVFASRLMPGSDSALRVPSLTTLTDDLGQVSDLRPRGRHLSRRGGRAWRRDLLRTGGVPGFSSLTVQREPEPFIMTFHPSARTDSEGQPIRLASQDVTGIDITLQRARRLQVSGILLDSQGTPASTNALLVRKRGLSVFDNR